MRRARTSTGKSVTLDQSIHGDRKGGRGSGGRCREEDMAGGGNIQESDVC